MSSFNEALRKAGIGTDQKNDYNKKKAGAFTLELKLYEMKDHIAAMIRIYQKYLDTEGEDKFDFIDSMANRYGYMVIAFQDIMTTIGKLSGTGKKKEDYSIRRAVSEFQSLFSGECHSRKLDDAVSSFADRNEIVHVYENYEGNMETVLENVQNYRDEYQIINSILWNYCEKKNILQSSRKSE